MRAVEPNPETTRPELTDDQAMRPFRTEVGDAQGWK